MSSTAQTRDYTTSAFGLEVTVTAAGRILARGPVDLRSRFRQLLGDTGDWPVAWSVFKAEESGVDLCTAGGCWSPAIWSKTGLAADCWCDTHRPGNLADEVNLPPVDEPDVLRWGWDDYPPLPLPDENGYPVLPAFVGWAGEAQVWCLYCSGWHHHGGWGHRIAHCTRPDSPYHETGYVLRQVGLVCRDHDGCDRIAGGIGDLSGLPLCAEHHWAERHEEAA